MGAHLAKHGAGFPFAVIPKHYLSIADGAFLLFIDYPTSERSVGNRQVRLKVLGDERLSCKLYLHRCGVGEFREVTVSAATGAIQPHTRSNGAMCYELQGQQDIVVSW